MYNTFRFITGNISFKFKLSPKHTPKCYGFIILRFRIGWLQCKKNVEYIFIYSFCLISTHLESCKATTRLSRQLNNKHNVNGGFKSFSDTFKFIHHNVSCTCYEISINITRITLNDQQARIFSTLLQVLSSKNTTLITV